MRQMLATTALAGLTAMAMLAGTGAAQASNSGHNSDDPGIGAELAAAYVFDPDFGHELAEAYQLDPNFGHDLAESYQYDWDQIDFGFESDDD
jgi:hypothetical protein